MTEKTLMTLMKHIANHPGPFHISDSCVRGNDCGILGSIWESPERGPFLSLLLALLRGTLLRGSLSPRVPDPLLIRTPMVAREGIPGRQLLIHCVSSQVRGFNLKQSEVSKKLQTLTV